MISEAVGVCAILNVEEPFHTSASRHSCVPCSDGLPDASAVRDNSGTLISSAVMGVITDGVIVIATVIGAIIGGIMGVPGDAITTEHVTTAAIRILTIVGFLMSPLPSDSRLSCHTTYTTQCISKRQYRAVHFKTLILYSAFHIAHDTRCAS
ncbi:MAG: hypothetical protein GX795_08430 [Firmicutes bacterium]|nr:hypothetical protein [Bacillota bacterium]